MQVAGRWKSSQMPAHYAKAELAEHGAIARVKGSKLATYSMRKSFAQRLYDQTGDIFTVQEMLGHKSVATTQRYLGVNYASVREAVEKMAFSASERKKHENALRSPLNILACGLTLSALEIKRLPMTRMPR